MEGRNNLMEKILNQNSELLAIPKYSNGLFYSLKDYLDFKFGVKVQRITLEANLDCPNRDGKKTFGGCTFCTADGSSAGAFNVTTPIKDQLIEGVELFSKRFKAKKFIAYLQSFTNTYAPIEKLKQIYDDSISHPDIAVLAVGTRPDCLEDEVLDLLESYSDRVEVWIDLGIQTVHNRTLDLINRAHTSEEFFDALARAKRRNLKVITHTIFGLPGENKEDYYETMQKISDSPIDGIKIHQLLVLEKTKMQKDYSEGKINILDLEEYIDLVCDFLEMLSPHVVIHRLFAEAKPNELIAPKWAETSVGGRVKQQILADILANMQRRNVVQGSRFVPGVLK